MTRVPRPTSLQLIAFGAVSFGMIALASGQAVERTLHEYFQGPSNYAALRKAPVGAPTEASSPSTDQSPRLPSREPGEPPPLTLSVSDDEPVVGQNGPQSSESLDNPQGELDPLSAQNQLDNDTDRVDELNYFSSFDPSVIPYKRLVSQNAISLASGQYTFSVDPGRATSLEVGRDASASRDEDTFWGTFLVKASPGVRLPIASVAPNQRILDAQTEPPAPVSVNRDEAGNYSLVIDGSGLTRVNLHIAVPRSYFIGTFGSTTWGALDRTKVVDLPDEAHRQALLVLARMGLSRRDDAPLDVLTELIRYFRAFEGKPFPDDLRGDDLYFSIATKQVGVCRHRSFAFVITASAIGIPTRYVYNEAHAFVEVHWPGLGWRRVDLGGAAQDVLLRNQDGQDQRVHDTGAPDSLPQPEAYREELARMAEQEEQRRDNAEEGTNGGFDDEGGPMSQEEGAAGPGDGPGDSTEGGSDDEGDTYDPSDFERDERTLSRVTISSHPDVLQRGESFSIAGELTSVAGRAIPGQEVHIILRSAQAPQGSTQGKLLGSVKTDASGGFSANLPIPRDLPLGRWSLIVSYKGDAEFQPQHSE